MQKKFTPMGKIQKHHDALQVQVDGWTWERSCRRRGRSETPNGHAVDVQFAETPRPRSSRLCRQRLISRSGKAVNVRIESRLMTTAQGSAEGLRSRSPSLRPGPIIDATEQREAIDAGLLVSRVLHGPGSLNAALEANYQPSGDCPADMTTTSP